MDGILFADTVDDDMVRVDLHGETHDISVAVAEQLSRDLNKAIVILRNDQGEFPKLVLTDPVNDIEHALKQRCPRSH